MTDPPTVNSIERVGVNFRQILTPKISPKVNPTVQVRITLSEQPKAFGKDHINVTEAAVASVVQLVPQGGTSFADFAASDAAPGDFPRTRVEFDEDLTGVDNVPGVVDTNELVALGASATLAQVEAREMYGGIHRAINEAKILTGTPYKYKAQGEASATDLVPDAVDIEFGIATGNASGDDPATFALKFSADDDTSDAIDVPSKPGETVAKPTAPKRTDFGDGALYTGAVNEYVADFNGDYATNANAWARYNAYMAAVEKEQMMDEEAQMEAYEELAASARAAASIPTGRDAMVYPYLVTLTPKYANTNDVRRESQRV